MEEFKNEFGHGEGKGVSVVSGVGFVRSRGA